MYYNFDIDLVSNENRLICLLILNIWTSKLKEVVNYNVLDSLSLHFHIKFIFIWHHKKMLWIFFLYTSGLSLPGIATNRQWYITAGETITIVKCNLSMFVCSQEPRVMTMMTIYASIVVIASSLLLAWYWSISCMFPYNVWIYLHLKLIFG
jgi:hypothetical protein